MGSRIVKDKPKNINLWFTTRGQNADDNRHILKFDLLEPSSSSIAQDTLLDNSLAKTLSLIPSSNTGVG